MNDDEVRWLDPTETQAWRGSLDLHAHLRTTLNRDPAIESRAAAVATILTQGEQPG